MNINIIGRQVTISDDIREFVEKKLAKFDRYFPKGADAAVTFRKVRDTVCAEITITVGGTLFRGEETNSDYRTAVTRSIDAIEGQIRKNKTRLEKRMKTTFAAAAAAVGETEAPVEEEGVFDIREKTFQLKPMTPEEAILQMNLLGHSFYVFGDADTGETCVVYKRNAGSYGLIKPEKKENYRMNNYTKTAVRIRPGRFFEGNRSKGRFCKWSAEWTGTFRKPAGASCTD